MKEDSQAMQNANSILVYSKKEFSQKGTVFRPESELKTNVNQLLINNSSFSTINGGKYCENLSNWFLQKQNSIRAIVR